MYTSSLPASLLLAVTASLLSSRAAADSCSAVGSLTTNSAGFGEGGTTNAYSNGITLFKGSTVVGNWTQCNDCSSVCSDLVTFDSQLPYSFSWGASCDTNTFKECHGAYGSQTHIDGDKPQSGTDFYGLGVAASAECKVEFQC